MKKVRYTGVGLLRASSHIINLNNLNIFYSGMSHKIYRCGCFFFAIAEGVD